MNEASLAFLANRLRDAHSEAALEEIKSFSDRLKNSKARIAVFNADGGLLRSPITLDETQALGFTQADDQFVLLQGDIVSTESAYFLGERVTGNPKYVVLNSSCDLVPDRRSCAALLRVTPIKSTETDAKEKLNLLLKFWRFDSMYLPPLPTDAKEVIANVVLFDGICQILSSDLLLATRIASLSLVGWRMFAAFARTVIARTTSRETSMRVAVDSVPEQQRFPED